MAAASSEGLRDIGSSSSSSSNAPPPPTSISSSSPRWVQDLNVALDKNSADMHSRFMQLATVRHHDDEEGSGFRPHVRWVVFRGFAAGNATTLKIITDSRSDKVEDLKASPFAELAWYFVASREQFRLTGRVQLVTATETDPALALARTQQWAALSDNARLQFIWPVPKASQEEDGMSDEARKAVFNPPAPPASSPPPDTFVLLLFHPSQVDHLQLRPNPQLRTIHDKKKQKMGKGVCMAAEEEWESRRVNP